MDKSDIEQVFEMDDMLMYLQNTKGQGITFTTNLIYLFIDL